MKSLSSLYKNYTCLVDSIEIGDEYKVYDLERDPFYGQCPEKYLALQAHSQWNKELTFRKKLYYELEKIAYYYTGEYKELNDEEFNVVWPYFFPLWYYEQVWVCYSEEMLELERKSWKGRDDIIFDKALGNNPYRLFRLVKRIDDTHAVYSSVFTGLQYDIDEDKVPMVWASANNGKFYQWWLEPLKNWIGGMQLFFDATNLLPKRVLRQMFDPQRAEEEDRSLNSSNLVFDVNRIENLNGDYNNYDKFDIMPPEVPKAILDTISSYFETESSKLGYTQNMNDKKERLTTGENYKDLHGVSNIQSLMLNYLDVFAKNFKAKYEAKDLKFGLTNQSDADGIPNQREGQFEEEEGENKDEMFVY